MSKLSETLERALSRSRGSTKRSRTSPLGERSFPSVAMGNLQASRVAILLLLCAARSVFWVVEQPKGSLLELHPLIQKVFKMINAYKLHIRMGDYGGETLKPTWLYSGLTETNLNLLLLGLLTTFVRSERHLQTRGLQA